MHTVMLRSAAEGGPRLRTFLAAALIALLAPLALAQPAAQANTAPNGAYWDANAYCNPRTHVFDPYLLIRPQPGRSRQWVAWRYYIRDLNTGEHVLGRWKTELLDWSTTTDVGGGGHYVGPGRMRIWHQVTWWNGSAWTSNTGWVQDSYRYSYNGNWINTSICQT